MPLNAFCHLLTVLLRFCLFPSCCRCFLKSF